MNDVFITRVRAAAVAGWWTVLVGVGLTVLLWLIYLCMMTTRPACVLCLWGPNMTWLEIQHISLWAIAVFKLLLWLLVLIVVWLTLWSRQLKKLAATS
jgi:hypothetical protein